MGSPTKNPPAYAIASVDHALRMATVLQLEGTLTVAEAADSLGVARSTAHRLLQMLVYRDFAAQDTDRSYHAGPVLELAAHSRSDAARVRAAALPVLQRLVDVLEESANVAVRVGATTRFIASVESQQTLRVGSREGMVFPAHLTTAGLLQLADLDPDELTVVHEAAAADTRAPDLDLLARKLAAVRREGFAVNREGSERGVVAVGVPIRESGGRTVAGLSVSMPSVRYEASSLQRITGILRRAAFTIEAAVADGTAAAHGSGRTAGLDTDTPP
jgi:DNA-binding IclR family transcriptional regulator